MRYNLFMGVNEMRFKILPLLCRLGLVLRLGSVYFDVSGISSLGKEVNVTGFRRIGIRRNGA